MDFLSQLFYDLINDYTVRSVTLGSAVLGIISGSLGTFAVLRQQSLLGDAVSHAALPGIALAFLITGTKSHFILVIGALVAGWVGTLFFMGITKRTRIKNDSALGIILSVFFGFGLVLLTYIQKQSNAAQAGIEKFLFGQAAAIITNDILIMVILGSIALIIMLIFWKEFKILTFDSDFGSSLGFPMNFIDLLLTGIIVIAIVIGLQTVGVVLMSAMIIAPATAARQWTNSLGKMTVLSAIFGAIAGISGGLISSNVEKLPTGPIIIISISVIVLISILFAPNRGLVGGLIRKLKNKHNIKLNAVLLDLYELASKQHHNDYKYGHNISTIKIMSGERIGVGNTLKILEMRGLVKSIIKDEWISDRGSLRFIQSKEWVLTDKGYNTAKKIVESTLQNNIK